MEIKGRPKKLRQTLKAEDRGWGTSDCLTNPYERGRERTLAVLGGGDVKK